MKKIPNPGSDDAIKMGCICPVLDNGHGKGSLWGKDIFWMNTNCPIHGNDNDNKKKMGDSVKSGY